MIALRFIAGPVSAAVAIAASIYLIGPYSPALCVLAIVTVFWGRALLRGLAFITVCIAAFLLGTWDLGKRAWKWFNEAPPVRDWDAEFRAIVTTEVNRLGYTRWGIEPQDWRPFNVALLSILRELGDNEPRRQS